MRSSISIDGSPTVLRVEQSVQAQRWVHRLDPSSSSPAEIAQAAGVHPVLAKVLAGRGITQVTAADALSPTLRALMPDPSTLRDMDAAASLLARAAEARATIGLFGDYDVDGAASCALMARWLQALGCSPIIHIPDRITEGYGPNTQAIDDLASQGIDLLITLDCGATSHEALAHAKAKGLPVLVLDHHQMSDLSPAVDALVNPNRPDDTSGLGTLCAAGVTFMALVAANRELRKRGHYTGDLPNLLAMLDLVALATVADVVPLLGLNRAFVTQGLAVARAGQNVGLAALVQSARLSGPMRAYHLGFVLGPRINAGGRIGDAAMGARLLVSQDAAEAHHLAQELDTLNAQRQALEATAVADALGRAQRDEGAPCLMLRDDGWHQGLVGLIASRVKEACHKPTFAFTLGSDGAWVGSARSVPGIDIGAAVRELVAEGLALKGGGHAMAAGLTLSDQGWDPAHQALMKAIDEQTRGEPSVRKLEVDAVLTASGASLDLAQALEQAAPYGSGFPEPVFAFPSHTVTFAEPVGSQHVRVSLGDGQGPALKGIAFRALDTELGKTLLESRGRGPLHVAGALSINAWQGRESVQLRILDVALTT